jgi:hypothetical protein
MAALLTVAGASALAALASRVLRSAPVDETVSIGVRLGLPIRLRGEWGAQPPRHNNPGERGFYDATLNPGGWRVYDQALEQILRAIAVHHSADGSRSPRDIQNIHFSQQRFADIGYHFVIDQAGVIWEGRPINVRGANVSRHNTGTIGICLLGNFETQAPQAAQLDTLRALSAALRDVFGVVAFAGHRDFPDQGTVCPGDQLALALPEIATALGLSRQI